MNTVNVTLGIYEAKSGDLKPIVLALIERHQKLLVAKGYVLTRPPMILEQGNFFIETISWNAGSAELAHSDDDVLGVWESFSELVHFKTLADLPDANKRFPGFLLLPLETGRQITLEDTMIPAKDFQKLADFYRGLTGLSLNHSSDDYVNLQDTITGNSLCVVKDEACGQSAPSFAVRDINVALELAKNLGAKIVRHWEYRVIVGANLTDPENNEFLMWQMKE